MTCLMLLTSAAVPGPHADRPAPSASAVATRHAVRIAATIVTATLRPLMSNGAPQEPINRRFARQVLLAPGFVRKLAATQAHTAEERWMLRQARAVRESYVREVLEADDDDDRRAEIWMLRQADDVRESYVRDVLEPGLE